MFSANRKARETAIKVQSMFGIDNGTRIGIGIGIGVGIGVDIGVGIYIGIWHWHLRLAFEIGMDNAVSKCCCAFVFRFALANLWRSAGLANSIFEQVRTTFNIHSRTHAFIHFSSIFLPVLLQNKGSPKNVQMTPLRGKSVNIDDILMSDNGSPPWNLPEAPLLLGTLSDSIKCILFAVCWHSHWHWHWHWHWHRHWHWQLSSVRDPVSQYHMPCGHSI